MILIFTTVARLRSLSIFISDALQSISLDGEATTEEEEAEDLLDIADSLSEQVEEILLIRLSCRSVCIIATKTIHLENGNHSRQGMAG